EAGGQRALIGRQRKIPAVRQAHDADVDGAAHDASAAAMPAISMAATSSFDCGGQGSMPRVVTSWIVLRSPPMMPVCGETSLARIQSQPLLASLALALVATFSVSAAKPITSWALRFAVCDGREDVGIFHQRQ